MREGTQENNIAWIDNLRALATFAVIWLHVAAGGLYKFDEIPLSQWMTANIFNSISRFCVPIFLMITGALLLPKQIQLESFLKRGFTRIILPFIFWSLVYIAFKIGESESETDIAATIFSNLQIGSSYHLWYVYTLIGIYLFIPIISQWIRHCPKKEIHYFLVIWFFTFFLKVPAISAYMPRIELVNFAGYMGYVVLGYYLSIQNFRTPGKEKNIGIWLALSGFLITAVGTAVMSVSTGDFFEKFYGYLTPNVVLLSCGVFIIAKHYTLGNQTIKIIVRNISKHGYGIYLAHVLVLYFMAQLGMDWSFFHPIIGIPLSALICLALSYVVVYVLAKMPFGKHIAG